MGLPLADFRRRPVLTIVGEMVLSRMDLLKSRCVLADNQVSVQRHHPQG